MNRVSRNPRVATAQQDLDKNKNAPGVRVLFIGFWLSVNSLSSPVNGSSEGR